MDDTPQNIPRVENVELVTEAEAEEVAPGFTSDFPFVVTIALGLFGFLTYFVFAYGLPLAFALLR